MALMKVRYKGLSDVRVFTQKDLKAHNVEVSRDLRFSRENGWQVTMESISPNLERILRDAGTFTISEVKDGVESAKVEAVKSDDIADSVEDTSTGQRSTRSTPRGQ